MRDQLRRSRHGGRSPNDPGTMRAVASFPALPPPAAHAPAAFAAAEATAKPRIAFVIPAM